MPGKWTKIRGDKVKCEVCGTMIRRDNISHHRRNMHEDITLYCPCCEYEAKYNQPMKDHLKIHDEGRGYIRFKTVLAEVRENMRLLQDERRMRDYRMMSTDAEFCICPDKHCTLETIHARTMIRHIKTAHGSHPGYNLVLLPKVKDSPEVLQNPERVAELGSEARRIRLCPLCNEMIDKNNYTEHIEELHDVEELYNEEMTVGLKYVKDNPKSSKDHKLMSSLYKSVVMGGEAVPPVRVPIDEQEKRCPFCNVDLKEGFKSHMEENHGFKTRNATRKFRYMTNLDERVLTDEKLRASLYCDMKKTHPEWKHLCVTTVIAH